MAECARQLVLEPYLVLLKDVRSSSHYVQSLKIFFSFFSALINQLRLCFVLGLSSCVCLTRLRLLTHVYCTFDMIQLKRFFFKVLSLTRLLYFADVRFFTRHCLRLLQKHRMKQTNGIVIRDSLRNDMCKRQATLEELKEERQQQRMDISRLEGLIRQSEERMIGLRKRYEVEVKHRNDRLDAFPSTICFCFFII